MIGKFSDDMYSWVFPTISTEKKNGGLIHTTIYAGIMNGKVDSGIISKYMNPLVKGSPNPDYDPNFGFSNVAVKLEESYLDGFHIPDKIGFYVTEHHHDGSAISFGVISFVMTGKNLKRVNRTNVFTQALRDATSNYNKKNKENNNKGSGVVLPMLAQGESLSADEDTIKSYIENNITPSGLYCQPKYDGVRCLATLNPKFSDNKAVVNFNTEEKVICYSRMGNKIFMSQHLLDELDIILSALQKKLDTEILILDGEFYLHGLEFSYISGAARGSEYTDVKNRINYIVYDYYDGKNTPFALRRKNLIDSCEIIENAIIMTEIEYELADDISEFGRVILAPTELFNNVTDIYNYYLKMIADSYEGIMLRSPSGLYEKGSRSKNLVKIKPMISREYKCIRYEFGTGKDEGIPKLICELGKKGVKWGNDWRRAKNENIGNEVISPRLTFGVKIKGMTMDEQRRLGIKFGQVLPNGNTVFDQEYKGKYITVEFYSYSNECKPEKANCKGLRLD
jgi:ATP-dependent DNA ligase